MRLKIFQALFAAASSLSLMGLGGCCSSMNRHDPPVALVRSAETCIERMYAVLEPAPPERRWLVLYGLLEPDVIVYYLNHPHTEHPTHVRGEYRVNLCLPRWHATVKPARRAVTPEGVVELWTCHYGGQSRWYDKLDRHHYIYTVTSPAVHGVRTILSRSERIDETIGHQTVPDVAVLPDGREVRLPVDLEPPQ
ncbi:MAG: hypothetical protein FLDDKLPJ_02805 [Phycisphaerae bacterium]|nr:hypothetical protein [Phycisphaerae bacterium]